jgi:peptidyl-prolyl cis-trans isomerase D
MLAQLRSLAKTPAVVILLGLLMASFLLWGVRDVFRNLTTGDFVVQAGAHSLSEPRFRQIVQQKLDADSRQSGQQISLQDAVKAGLDRQAADALATEESFAEYLSRTGLRPSDVQLVEEIRKIPQFFSPISEAFDEAAYKRFVGQQLNMTPPEFEDELRSELAQNQFVSGVAAGLHAPRLYDALVAAVQMEGRSFSYFVLPITAVPPPAPPTEAQMTDFIKQNADRLKQPETRALSVIRFSAAEASAAQPVDEAAVQKRFDFEKDSLSTPEKRSLIEVPAKDAATAAAVSARLKRGEDPNAVAKSLGVTPVPYTDVPKSSIVDPAAADAAFALQAGAVSGPIRGALGYSVVKVTSATPGHVATLKENRAKIEAEVRKSAGQAKINQQVKAYEDARSGGASLDQAAQKLGLSVVPVPPVTAQGTTLQGQRFPIAPKLLQAAFTLQPGADSDVVDLGQGDYAVARVDKIIPPAPPPLDEIRPKLTQFLEARDVETRLQAKASSLADQIRKGQPMANVAAAAGSTVQQAVGIDRTQGGQAFNRNLIGEIFAAKVGDVLIGPDVKPGGIVVAKLSAVVPAAGPAAAQVAANQQASMSRSLLQDLGVAARNAAKAAIKPRVDYARAHAALGGGDAGPAQ